MTTAAPTTFRFTRDEYYQMVDLGFFHGRRAELIHGKIFDMSPQRDPHATATGLAQYAFAAAFPDHWTRIQLPLTLTDSEPEPDIALVPGSPRDYTNLGYHPNSASLVMEIAEPSLKYDRHVKAPLYAAAGIKDFWILNLPDRCLEVYRNPRPDASSPTGFRYADLTTLTEDNVVSPLANPAVAIPIADLLP